MRSELAGATTLVCLVLAVFLGVAFVLPETPLTVVSSNLRPYLAIGLLVLSAVLLLAGRPGRAALFALVAGGAGLHVASVIVQQRGQWDLAGARPGSTEVRLLSFNIYNRNDANGPAIANFLAGSDAEVVMVMEAGPIEAHLPQLAETYPYRVGCGERTDTCDLLILSRRPILDAEVDSLGPISPDRYMSIAVEIDNRRVTFVAAHLVKPYFDGYGWLEVRRLGRKLEEMDGPVVVAGDFNAASWSSTMELLIGRTGLETGPWPVGTWPSEFGTLGLPIDHVLARDGAHVVSKDPLQNSFGSNHRGLLSTISLTPG